MWFVCPDYLSIIVIYVSKKAELTRFSTQHNVILMQAIGQHDNHDIAVCQWPFKKLRDGNWKLEPHNQLISA